MKSWYGIALGVVLVAALSACGQAPPPPQPDAPPQAAPAAPAVAPANPATAAFKCPMPEDNFFAAAMGKCPKCGMDLVPNMPNADSAAATAGTSSGGTQMACACATNEPGCDCRHCSTKVGACGCSHGSGAAHQHRGGGASTGGAAALDGARERGVAPGTSSACPHAGGACAAK